MDGHQHRHVTITALAVAHEVRINAGAQVRTATAIRLLDAATEPLAVKPIPPGQTVALPFGAPVGSAQGAPQVRAALLRDGTSFGDPQWAQRLQQRRTYMRQRLGAVMRDLAASMNDGLSRETIVAQFEAALAQEKASAANEADRACIDSARGLALKNLQAIRLRPDGSAVETGEVLSRILGSLGSRLQALLSLQTTNAEGL